MRVHQPTVTPDTRTNSRRRRAPGFTLIEIILAFAIFALAAGALFQSFSTGLRATEVGDRQGAAVLAARSLLDRVGIDIPLAAGEKSGRTDDGMAWRIAIGPAAILDPQRAADSPVLPFVVEVTVSAERGQPVTLTTLRLVAAGGAAQ